MQNAAGGRRITGYPQLFQRGFNVRKFEEDRAVIDFLIIEH
jgi:hypothetical protein